MLNLAHCLFLYGPQASNGFSIVTGSKEENISEKWYEIQMLERRNKVLL